MDVSRIPALAWEYHSVFLAGAGVTISLTVLSMAIAVLAGLFFCLGSMSRNVLLRWPSIVFIEFFRNTPILVLVVWVHFALPDLIGVKFVAYFSSVLALAFQSTGYLSEEYRAGIESIDRGQFDAGRALGMTYPYLMRRIIIPQALVKLAPALLNQFVLCFKSTAVVSVIAVPDIMYHANVIVNETFLSMQIYTIAALMYFLLVFAVSSGARFLSRTLFPNQSTEWRSAIA
ncbi:MAG: amino acid ABC transporter permease [Pseudomonadota bacterium]